MPTFTRLLLPGCAGAAAAAFVTASLGCGDALTAAAAGCGALAAAWPGARWLGRRQELAEQDVVDLRKRMKEQRDQMADTVHELRTPLSALRAAVEMLRDGYAGSPEEQAEFLDQAACAAQHLGFLTNDMLDLAAVEAGRLSLHLRPLQARDLCNDSRQVMAPLAKSRGIGLTIVEPPMELRVTGDRSRILQVAFNLLSNAVKYSERGSTVQLSVRAQGTQAVFEVADQGLGVPLERRPALFTRFGRGGGEGREVESTGLGLHLCRMLTERMGGQVGHREGENGQGSVFWFSLPLAPRTAETVPGVATAAPLPA